MMKSKKQLTLEFVGIAIIVAVVIAAVILICSITVPAKAEEIGFPSPREYDAELVKDVQHALNICNGDDEQIKVDGKFGPKSARATKRAQRALGLSPTGVIDDDFARLINVRNWPFSQGYTMYYAADLERIYRDESDYEDLVYIALGGRSNLQHFSLFRDGTLIAETDLEIDRIGHFPVGVTSFGKLDRRGWLKKTDLPEDLLDWLRENESRDITVVIDDRAYQPSTIGYDALLEDTDYADCD